MMVQFSRTLRVLQKTNLLSPMAFFLCLFLITSSFAFFIYVFLHRKTSSQPTVSDDKLPLPPGRNGWPIIGESIDYFSALKDGVPENFVTKRLNMYSTKVFRTSMLGEPMAMLCGAQGNKFLFSNEGKLVETWLPEFVGKIFPSNRTVHEITAQVRKVVRPFLKADALNKYIPVVDSIMRQHLETEWNVKQVKVSEVVQKYTFATASLLFLSMDDPKKNARLCEQMRHVVDGTMSMAIDFPGTAFHRAMRASKLVRKELEETIQQRKIDVLQDISSQKDDLLSQMLVTGDENGQIFEGSDIAGIMIGLLHGSTHTVNSALASIMMYLAELPDVYHQVLNEQMEIARSKDPSQSLNWEDLRKMKYSWNVANEVLRLKPPSVGTFREAITDFTYDGHTIPKGWKLHWMTYATHKNPEYFPDPEKFDPSRFEGSGPPPFTFVPFGGGPRMCPGNEYARLVILVFMHHVVTNFRWVKMIVNEKLVSDPVPRPTHGLPILLHPH